MTLDYPPGIAYNWYMYQFALADAGGGPTLPADGEREEAR